MVVSVSLFFNFLNYKYSHPTVSTSSSSGALFYTRYTVHSSSLLRVAARVQ